MADEELTPAEKEELKDLLGYGSNIPESKQNVHTFLHNVATADDTTKLGYITAIELGNTQNPVRAFKHLATFAKEIMNKPELATYFNNNSEIITSTSLSRDGFLVDRAVVQKRELKDTTNKTRKENSGWFKGKDKNKEQEGGIET
jgi:hypothetical protein